MLDEPLKEKKGILQDRPLLVFIWAVLPIVFVFGFTLSSNLSYETSIFEEIGFYNLIVSQILAVLVMLLLPGILLSSFYNKNPWKFLNLLKMPSLAQILLAFGLILSANFFINFLVTLNELIPLSSFWEQKFSNLHEQASETQAYFLNYSGLDQLIWFF